MRVGLLLVVTALPGCQLVFDIGDAKVSGAGILAISEVGATELVVDHGALFWTIRDNPGAIRTCDPTDCRPRSIATDGMPHALVVDGDVVLWAADTRLRSAQRTAPDASSVVTVSDNDGFPTTIVSFVRTGEHIFWTSANGLSRCNYNRIDRVCTSNSVMSLRIQGALVVEKQALSSRAWGEGSDAGLATLINFDTRADLMEAPWFRSDAALLEVSDTHLFALRANNPDLLAWPLSAQPTQEPQVIPTDGVPVGITVGNDTVYLADLGGRVLAISASSPDAPVVIADGLAPVRAVAVTATQLFAIVGDSIVAFETSN